MKILVDILHPAHVHKFKNIIQELEKRGHMVFITARNKDVTLQLLEAYNLQYTCWKKGKETLFGKVGEYLSRFVKLLFYCRKLKPDALIGLGGLFISPVGKFLGVPSLILCEEDEFKFLTNPIYYMSTIMCTPMTFKKDFGRKQIRFKGYPELSYTRGFKPNPDDLHDLGLAPDSKYFILRCVSWKAIHDYGQKGFDRELIANLISRLEKYGKVFISSEGNNLPEEFRPYLLKIEPQKLHSILYYASLFVGDGQAMSVEAGLLGTPSIRFNSIVNSNHGKGKFDMLTEKKILHSISDKDDLIAKVDELINDNDSKPKAIDNVNKFFSEMDDVTGFFVDTIESKPWISI